MDSPKLAWPNLFGHNIGLFQSLAKEKKKDLAREHYSIHRTDTQASSSWFLKVYVGPTTLSLPSIWEDLDTT